MIGVTSKQWVNTYEETVRLTPRETWPTWVKAMHFALTTGYESPMLQMPHLESPYNMLKAQLGNTISKADSR